VKRGRSGTDMFALALELWPIGRSISGQGVRDSLAILKKKNHRLNLETFKSGTKVFDWVVPPEWNVRSARIVDPKGQTVCDYKVNNLHLVGYSVPFKGIVTKDELLSHLYTLPQQPEAIPYVTSYYEEKWGFCISENQKLALAEGDYSVEVDTTLTDGVLDYGEIYIPGKSQREILFSTYICHPSMANNELSGPVLALELSKLISKRDDLFYSYRFLFLPETIGSISYLAENLGVLKENVLAGYVLTCVGDERSYSYVPSRSGKTVADKVALATMESLSIEFKKYDWNDRGSDERQYCAPGVDLPVCSVMRTKYGEFPEYHTSEDTLGVVVTEKGLVESLDLYLAIISNLEKSRYPKIKVKGEPQLSKRGLYPSTSIKGAYGQIQNLMNVISQLDGTNSISDIAFLAGVSTEQVLVILEKLDESDLLVY
jgi:aminopeptidase-like protein